MKIQTVNTLVKVVRANVFLSIKKSLNQIHLLGAAYRSSAGPYKIKKIYKNVNYTVTQKVPSFTTH